MVAHVCHSKQCVSQKKTICFHPNLNQIPRKYAKENANKYMFPSTTVMLILGVGRIKISSWWH